MKKISKYLEILIVAVILTWNCIFNDFSGIFEKTYVFVLCFVWLCLTLYRFFLEKKIDGLSNKKDKQKK